MMITKNAKESWKEYLSQRPETRELAGIFFINPKGQLNEMAWEELKTRDDIKNRDILEVILFCQKPRWVKDDAWKMLLEKGPSKEDLERISRNFLKNDPIMKELISKFGRNKSYLLERVKEDII